MMNAKFSPGKPADAGPPCDADRPCVILSPGAFGSSGGNAMGFRSFALSGITGGAVAVAFFAFSAAGITPSCADQWPAHPISVVVPFSPGNAVDIAARIVMEQVSQQVGQPIIVDNRGGAGGAIGSNIVAKAAADGHTILASGSLASAHALSASLPYSTLDDFVPLISLGLQPLVIVTGPDAKFGTLAELVARAKGGTLNFASAGVGSATHLAAERFRMSAGFEAQHVPFKGPAEALTDIMAGRVDFYVAPASTALSLIQTGKVRALAVSGTKRAAVLPDIPTTTELGFADSAYALYVGLFLPAKTEPAIVQRLYREVEASLGTTGVKDKLVAIGVEPMPMSQPQFARYFRDDVEANIRLVKAAGIPLQK